MDSACNWRLVPVTVRMFLGAVVEIAFSYVIDGISPSKITHEASGDVASVPNIVQALLVSLHVCLIGPGVDLAFLPLLS